MSEQQQPKDPVLEFFSASDIEEIRKTAFVQRGDPIYNITEAEFSTLLRFCAKKRLWPAPFANQVSWQKRKDRDTGVRFVLITGVDGLLVLAERTGQLDGMSEGRFAYDQDPQTGARRIFSCTVLVYRKDRAHPSVGTAYFNEYVQNNRMWAEKPHLMIEKCALSLALRRAFPAELSALYTPEEMGAGDATSAALPPAVPPASPPIQTAPAAQAKRSPPWTPPHECQHGSVDEQGMCWGCGTIGHRPPQRAPAPTQMPPPQPPAPIAPVAPITSPPPQPAAARLADRGRCDRLSAAIGRACHTRNTPWEEMARMLTAWAGRRSPVTDPQGAFVPDLTHDELERILAGLRAWETAPQTPTAAMAPAPPGPGFPPGPEYPSLEQTRAQLDHRVDEVAHYRAGGAAAPPGESGPSDAQVKVASEAFVAALEDPFA